MPDKKFTRKEVQERTGGDNVFIIENLVYDVSQFLDEHPGGHEVLVQAKGTDVTEDYLDVGHSLDARELMRKYQIGELVDKDKVEVKRRRATWEETDVEQPSFWASWKLPLLLGVLATLFYSYLF